VIVDTSALVAIINGEDEAQKFSELLAASLQPKLSAASYLETATVVDRKKAPEASALVDVLLGNYGVQIVPVSERLARAARAAFNKYGKGMGHPAQLNFGDCFVYALAKTADEPLLFKGDDFNHTDVKIAMTDRS
jgi:ribonuclease VapC